MDNQNFLAMNSTGARVDATTAPTDAPQASVPTSKAASVPIGPDQSTETAATVTSVKKVASATTGKRIRASKSPKGTKSAKAVKKGSTVKAPKTAVSSKTTKAVKPRKGRQDVASHRTMADERASVTLARDGGGTIDSSKITKPKKHRGKPVRDSFTMPEADFALVATLKSRTLSAQRATKKSELLRAGLHALAAMSTPELIKALNRLEPIAVGRPKKR